MCIRDRPQAGRIRVPGLWWGQVVAYGPAGDVDVLGVRASDVGDGGHDLPPVPHAADDVVRGDLVRLCVEERGLGDHALGAGAKETVSGWSADVACDAVPRPMHRTPLHRARRTQPAPHRSPQPSGCVRVGACTAARGTILLWAQA